MRHTSLASLLLILAACGDDSSPPPPPPTDAGVLDTSMDAAMASDTSDVPMVDTGVPDAPSMQVECETIEVEFATDPITRARYVAASTDADGFVFGWGDAQSIREEVRIASLGYTGEASEVSQLTTDDNSARGVALADDYIVWLDDGGVASEYVVVGRPISGGEVRTLSSNAGQHDLPRVFDDGDGHIATWIRQNADDTWVIEIRSLGVNESPVVTLPFSLEFPAYDIAFVDDVAYVVWQSGDDAVVAQVDLVGNVVYEPNIVSDEHNAEGGVAIAFENGAGVVAFSVRVGGIRQEVRARLINDEAAPTRPERVVSYAPLRGRAPAAIAFGGGYALAYRATTPEGAENLRVAFVHGTDGDVVAEYQLGPSAFEDGAPGMTVGEGGVLGVGWAFRDQSPGATETSIRGARLACGEAWLRCGVMP